MKFFRSFSIWSLSLSFLFLNLSSLAFAADSGTVLPETTKTVIDCKALMNEVSKDSCWVMNNIFKRSQDSCKVNSGFEEPDQTILPKTTSQSDVLGCGIKTGTIHMWMIPYYIKYILTFIIGISGLAAVGGIVYGGYLYLFAGISSEKDQGKKAIQYGVIGMIMTLVAWAFVNIIISLFTG